MNPRDKMPLEVTPIYFKLQRYDASKLNPAPPVPDAVPAAPGASPAAAPAPAAQPETAPPPATPPAAAPSEPQQPSATAAPAQ